MFLELLWSLLVSNWIILGRFGSEMTYLGRSVPYKCSRAQCAPSPPLWLHDTWTTFMRMSLIPQMTSLIHHNPFSLYSVGLIIIYYVNYYEGTYCCPKYDTKYTNWHGTFLYTWTLELNSPLCYVKIWLHQFTFGEILPPFLVRQLSVWQNMLIF